MLRTGVPVIQNKQSLSSGERSHCLDQPFEEVGGGLKVEPGTGSTDGRSGNVELPVAPGNKDVKEGALQVNGS